MSVRHPPAEAERDPDKLSPGLGLTAGKIDQQQVLRALLGEDAGGEVVFVKRQVLPIEYSHGANQLALHLLNVTVDPCQFQCLLKRLGRMIGQKHDHIRNVMPVFGRRGACQAPEKLPDRLEGDDDRLVKRRWRVSVALFRTGDNARDAQRQQGVPIRGCVTHIHFAVEVPVGIICAFFHPFLVSQSLFGEDCAAFVRYSGDLIRALAHGGERIKRIVSDADIGQCVFQHPGLGKRIRHPAQFAAAVDSPDLQRDFALRKPGMPFCDLILVEESIPVFFEIHHLQRFHGPCLLIFLLVSEYSVTRKYDKDKKCIYFVLFCNSCLKYRLHCDILVALFMEYANE